jgi:ABC-2 type transport system permease protein
MRESHEVVPDTLSTEAISVELLTKRYDERTVLDNVSFTVPARVFVSAGAGSIFTLALGILASAGEFRHGTAVQAFLAVPRRVPVVVAKIATSGLVGLAFGLVCAAFCVAVALPWWASEAQAISLGDPQLWTVLAGVVLSTTLYGALGAALGALLGNQVVGLLVALGWGGLLLAVWVLAFAAAGIAAVRRREVGG